MYHESAQRGDAPAAAVPAPGLHAVETAYGGGSGGQAGWSGDEGGAVQGLEASVEVAAEIVAMLDENATDDLGEMEVVEAVEVEVDAEADDDPLRYEHDDDYYTIHVLSLLVRELGIPMTVDEVH